MPRQPRLDNPGLLHHVIFRGIEKGVIVKDDTDRLDFVARLNRLSVECSIEVYAWPLMDNHVHLLMWSNNYGLTATVVARFLGISPSAICKVLERN